MVGAMFVQSAPARTGRFSVSQHCHRPLATQTVRCGRCYQCLISLPDLSPKLEAIIGNIAAGLRPGAVVIHDGYLSEGIDERLRDRHLYPSAIAGIACANSVFVYEPQRPTEGLRGSLLDLRDKTLLAASKSHLFNRDR